MGIIVKALGIVDFAALVLILFIPWFPSEFVRYGAYWLMLKGGFFVIISKDFGSMLDVLAGFYIILLTFGISWDFLTILTLIFIGLKAGMSVFL